MVENSHLSARCAKVGLNTLTKIANSASVTVSGDYALPTSLECGAK